MLSSGRQFRASVTLIDNGGVAQLGERVNGIHEVRGSIPLASTGAPLAPRTRDRATESIGPAGRNVDGVVAKKAAGR